jgi:hypothetical protein
MVSIGSAPAVGSPAFNHKLSIERYQNVRIVAAYDQAQLGGS